MVRGLYDCFAREGRKQCSTMTPRRRGRHTPDWIIRMHAEAHEQLDAGNELDEVCRRLEIAESMLNELAERNI